MHRYGGEGFVMRGMRRRTGGVMRLDGDYGVWRERRRYWGLWIGVLCVMTAVMVLCLAFSVCNGWFGWV